MDIEKIKKANTLYIGKEIIYKKQMDSTQKLAKEMAKQKYINGTIVITDNQINGIGTKGRSWFSNKEKNITMTILINENIQISNLDGITLKIAEIIKKSIKQLYNYNLTIKEPNDLFLNNKKIGGILTQTSIIKNKLNYILIGIGFNVNEEVFDNNLANIATSLKIEFQKDFVREDIIIKIIENLERII